MIGLSVLRQAHKGARLLLAACVLIACGAQAQELTPRAYWPMPDGTNVFILAYQHSSGDILTDPSLPLADVDSKIDYLQVAYQRAFAAFGRAATLQLSLPLADGRTQGLVEGEFRSRETSGAADLRARFAINLLGAPSMDGPAFQALRRNPRTIVGASLLVQAPTGEYEADKLINLGTNRWSMKPAIGVIWPLRPTWLLEFELGAWFFGDNDDFLGQRREQQAILSTEVHLIKRIRPGFWASLDANFYVGGRTTVGGIERGDLQRNSRVGATAVFPIKGRHALRASISTGAVTESGGDYEIVSLSYLYAW